LISAPALVGGAGITFGSIAALYGLNRHLVDKSQYTARYPGHAPASLTHAH
jgi:hypothetical protein